MTNIAQLVVLINYTIFMLALIGWAIADIFQFVALGAAIESPEIQGIIYLASRIAQSYTFATAAVTLIILVFQIINRVTR
jgi:hypothetical protein